MRPKQLLEALKALWPTKRPTFVWGPPGVGKSQIHQQAAKELEIEYLDVRLVYHDPSDLKFPVFDTAEKTLTWVNSLFPKDPEWKGIIVLEEFPQSPPLMQSAGCQILLDRKVGDYTLPDGAWVVACGNRSEDRAGANRIITPILNRFIHLDLEVSNQDWQSWAAESGINHNIRAFLEMRPSALHEFNPSSGARAFPTPRSWEFVSQVMTVTPAELRYPVFAGCIGDGHAADFIGFLEYAEKLPKISDILAKPSTFKVPEEPSICVALAGALSEQCRDPQHNEAVATYVSRWQPEYATLGMRMCTQTGRQQFTSTKAALAWMKKNYHLLSQTG